VREGDGRRGEGERGGERRGAKVLHTDSLTYRHTDPPKKRVLEEHSLLKTTKHAYDMYLVWL
jgi:hypothetical protein